jgi:hypothetical protein
MVVGVPVHSADIFPALISNPASAKSRRSSVDFQIPRSAAVSRMFHRISSISLWCQSGCHPSVGRRPRRFDVLGRDV